MFAAATYAVRFTRPAAPAQTADRYPVVLRGAEACQRDTLDDRSGQCDFKMPFCSGSPYRAGTAYKSKNAHDCDEIGQYSVYGLCPSARWPLIISTTAGNSSIVSITPCAPAKYNVSCTARKRMAKLFGVSPDHYRKYERGERRTGLLAMHIWALEFLKKKRLLAKFEQEVEHHRQ